MNTHKGLFACNRLPFGVSSAPGIFQHTMETLLKGIPNVLDYLDDILIIGPTQEQHMKYLHAVLDCFCQAGLRLKKQKCRILAKSVEYLGFTIDQQGVHPSEGKVKAIKSAPNPTNLTELKFLPNLANALAPLYQLLKKDVKWSWGDQQQQSFDQPKQILTSSVFLAHYDPTEPLVLSCDTSQYGVRAVLSQVYNGDEKPVTYASRTLTTAERNYSQLEKEGLAVSYHVEFKDGRLCKRHLDKIIQQNLMATKIKTLLNSHYQKLQVLPLQ